VDSPWELVFMLLVLKIPMVYLGVVIWYAIKPAAGPEDGGDVLGVRVPIGPCGWNEWRDRRLAGARGRRPFRPIPRPGARRLPVPGSPLAA
jgi:hypothetical protein